MSEKVKIVTPVGDLLWVHISGQGKLNYNKDGREYVATVRLSGKPAEELKAAIDAVYDEDHTSKYNLRSKGYKELKGEDGKLTGEIDFNFKTQTTFQDGTQKTIQVFNKNAEKVSLGSKKIGNGSRGAISGSAQYYINGKEDGVSLWLNSVQLTKFVEYEDNGGFAKAEGDDGDFTGVQDDESGFTGQPEKETPKEEEQPKAAKPRL